MERIFSIATTVKSGQSIRAVLRSKPYECSGFALPTEAEWSMLHEVKLSLSSGRPMVVEIRTMKDFVMPFCDFGWFMLLLCLHMLLVG